VLASYALLIAPGGIRLREGEIVTKPGVSVTATNVTWRIRDTSLKEFAALLAYEVERPVIDETHTLGIYSFVLEWNRDVVSGDGSSGLKPLTEALERQMGLRLEARREVVEYYVVDGASRPRPD
jgi:uncharacterized protein (TIGR03435 family)